MNKKDELIGEIVEGALLGIDKCEEEDGGWWETSSGCDFGKEVLLRVIEVINKYEITKGDSNEQNRNI